MRINPPPSPSPRGWSLIPTFFKINIMEHFQDLSQLGAPSLSHIACCKFRGSWIACISEIPGICIFAIIITQAELVQRAHRWYKRIIGETAVERGAVLPPGHPSMSILKLASSGCFNIQIQLMHPCTPHTLTHTHTLTHCCYDIHPIPDKISPSYVIKALIARQLQTYTPTCTCPYYACTHIHTLHVISQGKTENFLES